MTFDHIHWPSHNNHSFLFSSDLRIVKALPFTIISKFIETSTPLWVYFISIIFGILTLILITYILHKVSVAVTQPFAQNLNFNCLFDVISAWIFQTRKTRRTRQIEKTKRSNVILSKSERRRWMKCQKLSANSADDSRTQTHRHTIELQSYDCQLQWPNQILPFDSL